MNARNAAPAADSNPRLESVPAPEGQRDATLQPQTGYEPPVTARRAGQLISGQDYAPVIRLQPRNLAQRGQPAGPGNDKRAQVIGIDAAEEKRRVSAITKSVGQAAVEVLAGTRQVSQLCRWLDPQSYERLQLRAAMIREQRERRNCHRPAAAGQLHRNPQVRSARLCRLADGIYEASLVVVEQTRARAVALRLEYTNGLWKVTALEIG